MFQRGRVIEFGNDGRSVGAINPGRMQTDMGGGNATVRPTDIAERSAQLYASGAFHQADGSFINTAGSPHQG